LFAHLEALTWTFPADGHNIAALAVYSQPIETPAGIVYRPFEAADCGLEGVACVDDVARAIVFGLRAWEHDQKTQGRDLARRWLSFLPYMQGADGRFTNFILDRAGTRNLAGPTSYPGGLWWTSRALWALGTAYRVLGDDTALEHWARCPLPTRQETASYAKVTGVLTLAALEVLRADPPRRQRRQFQQLLEDWTADLFACQDGYLRDIPGQARVNLWGYHQFPALVEAGAWLERSDYLQACQHTVERLIEPTLAAGFLYAYPGIKDNICAYCVSPMLHGLAALYRATGDLHYRQLALRACGWWTGSNDAGAIMYNPQTGRCLDAINDGHASPNCGAESSIEAGLAELERRLLQGTVQERPLASERLTEDRQHGGLVGVGE
jgi:hypothetical protein